MNIKTIKSIWCFHINFDYIIVKIIIIFKEHKNSKACYLSTLHTIEWPKNLNYIIPYFRSQQFYSAILKPTQRYNP